MAVLGLALTASLWWTYFGEGEGERALDAMLATPPRQRPRIALNG